MNNILSKQALYTPGGTGTTLYCIITRDQDLALYNATTGRFIQQNVATAIDSAVEFTEHDVAKGLFYINDFVAPLKDGKYILTIYTQGGLNPDPTSDTLERAYFLFIKTGLKVEFSTTTADLG